MKIVVFSVNYKTSSIELRERVAYSNKKLKGAYEIIRGDDFIKEGIIISTCNRSEIFALVEDVDLAEDYLKGFYKSFFNLEEGEIDSHYLFKSRYDAVRYLYEVCIGLDSLVLGEDQILGQVKDAYSKAVEYGGSGKALNKMFLEAITKAKEIKTKTNISENPLSISYIGIKQLEKHFNTLEGKNVLILGYGKMGELALKHLMDKGVNKIYICNRREKDIKAICEKNDLIEYIHFGQKYEYINQVDIVIGSTAAPHFVYLKEELEVHIKENKELAILDIALPRDIDPLIGEMKNIEIYHIDQLQEIANENMLFRKGLIDEINRYIDEGIDEYYKWYKCIPIYPKIKAIKDYSQDITEEELDKMFKKLSHIDNRDKETIETVVRSMVKKMWRTPILQLKNAGNQGRAEEMATFVSEFLGL